MLWEAGEAPLETMEVKRRDAMPQDTKDGALGERLATGNSSIFDSFKRKE